MAPQKTTAASGDDNIIIMLNGVPVVYVPQRDDNNNKDAKNAQKKTLSKGEKNSKNETRKQTKPS